MTFPKKTETAGDRVGYITDVNTVPEYRFWHVRYTSGKDTRFSLLCKRETLGVVATSLQHVFDLCHKLDMTVHSINHGGEIRVMGASSCIGQNFWNLEAQITFDRKGITHEKLSVVAPDCSEAVQCATQFLKEKYKKLPETSVFVLAVNKKGTVDHVVFDPCAKTVITLAK